MLIDNNSIGTCILPGKTRYIRAKAFEKEKGCGFFPFLGEVEGLATKGLRWNVGKFLSVISRVILMVHYLAQSTSTSIVMGMPSLILKMSKA